MDNHGIQVAIRGNLSERALHAKDFLEFTTSEALEAALAHVDPARIHFNALALEGLGFAECKALNQEGYLIRLTNAGYAQAAAEADGRP